MCKRICISLSLIAITICFAGNNDADTTYLQDPEYQQGYTDGKIQCKKKFITGSFLLTFGGSLIATSTSPLVYYLSRDKCLQFDEANVIIASNIGCITGVTSGIAIKLLLVKSNNIPGNLMGKSPVYIEGFKKGYMQQKRIKLNEGIFIGTGCGSAIWTSIIVWDLLWSNWELGNGRYYWY